MGLWDTPADPHAKIFPDDFVPPTKEELERWAGKMKQELADDEADERRETALRKEACWKALFQPVCTHEAPFLRLSR